MKDFTLMWEIEIEDVLWRLWGGDISESTFTCENCGIEIKETPYFSRNGHNVCWSCMDDYDYVMDEIPDEEKRVMFMCALE